MIANKKFVIQDVIIPDEEMHALEAELKSFSLSKHKHKIIKKYAGGVCACYRVPIKKISYDVSDEEGPGILVEWYCSECWNKNKSEVDNRLQNMNFA